MEIEVHDQSCECDFCVAAGKEIMDKSMMMIPATELEARIKDAWDCLLNKDDRTSPADYPEMCLITREELGDYMADAAFVENADALRWPIQAEGIELILAEHAEPKPENIPYLAVKIAEAIQTGNY
jgi:hypothetical protein